MSLRDQYLRAQFQDVHYVLGIRLRPYCLGHALLMDRMGSPFEQAGTHARIGDLKLAVTICRHPWDRAARVLNSRFVRWHLALVPILTEHRLALGMIQCAGYIADAHRGPRAWEQMDSSRLEMPVLEIVKVTLMMRLGKTEAEALSTPLSLALHDYAACWELLGRLKIIGDETERLMARAKELAMEAAHGK